VNEESLKEAEKLGIQFYQPSVAHSILFLSWWLDLNASKDFDLVFSEAQRPLSAFFKTFDPPALCAFALDEEDKVYLVMWLTAMSDVSTAAFVSYWCREEKRGTRKAHKITKLLFEIAFKHIDVLMSVTKHESLLRIFHRLGHTVVGRVPHYFNGEDAWILYLTKDNFENSKFYKVGEKI